MSNISEYHHYSNNGYGQFIDLESQMPVNEYATDIYIDIDNEYNEYLDRCDQMLEYGAPAYIYINHNQVVPMENINVFTNPLFYVVTYMINWIRR